MADLALGLPRASNQLSHPFEASQRIHPATQNACMFSASGKGKGNPKSQFGGNKNKSGVRIHSKKTQQNIDLTFPASGLLSHFTNSRPWFPFFSDMVVKRFSGAMRGQSGHLVIGSEPYRGHDDGEAELDMDISRLSPSGGDGRLRRRRRITIWWGKGKGGNDGRRLGTGTAMARASVICGWTRGQCTCFGSPEKITLVKKNLHRSALLQNNQLTLQSRIYTFPLYRISTLS